MYCAEIMAAGTTRFILPDLPSKPHQPASIIFPKRSFGKTKVVQRSFQSSWFQKWPFLHYDESKDVVFCHTCVRGFAENKVTAANADTSFVSCLQFLFLAFHDLYKLTVDI